MNRTQAVGLLAPAVLICFLLAASVLWRGQTSDSHREAPDHCSHFVQAVENGDMEAVRELLNRGCSANAKRPGVLSAPSDQEARKWLLTRSDRSRFAGTPVLEIAAQNNDLRLLRLLLARGAAVNGRGVYSYTALIRAASRANVEVVALLLKAGADPNLRDTMFGETALHKATRSASRRFPESSDMAKRRKKIVRLLLKGGADPNLTDNRGRKPLDGFAL